MKIKNDQDLINYGFVKIEGINILFIRLFPQLHQRLPIFMIASYIGVARETLTRIRSDMINLDSAGNSYAKPRSKK